MLLPIRRLGLRRRVTHGPYEQCLGQGRLVCSTVRRQAEKCQGSARQRVTQPAAAAQHGALLFSTTLLKESVHVISDCLGVLMCWRRGMQWASQFHQALDDIADGRSARDVLGKERADEFARTEEELENPTRSPWPSTTCCSNIWPRRWQRFWRSIRHPALFWGSRAPNEKAMTTGQEGFCVVPNASSTHSSGSSRGVCQKSKSRARMAKWWWACHGPQMPRCHAQGLFSWWREWRANKPVTS